MSMSNDSWSHSGSCVLFSITTQLFVVSELVIFLTATAYSVLARHTVRFGTTISQLTSGRLYSGLQHRSSGFGSPCRLHTSAVFETVASALHPRRSWTSTFFTRGLVTWERLLWSSQWWLSNDLPRSTLDSTAFAMRKHRAGNNAETSQTAFDVDQSSSSSAAGLYWRIGRVLRSPLGIVSTWWQQLHGVSRL